MNAPLSEQIANLQAFEAIAADQTDKQVFEFDENDPIAVAMEILGNHYANVIERQEQAERIEELETTSVALVDKLKAATVALENANAEVHDLHSQCRQLLNKHNSEVDKANTTITRLQATLRNEQAEVKRLKSINPEALKKQVRNLQAKNKELQEGNAMLNKRVAGLKKQVIEIDELRTSNAKLLQDNRALDNALQQMCDEHNDSSKTLLVDLGEWQIHSTSASVEGLTILDTITDTARCYRRDGGMAKIRPVPKAVLTAADAEFTKIAAFIADSIDYKGAAQ